MSGNLPRVGVQFVAEDSQPFLKAVQDGDRAVRNFGQTATDTSPRFSALEQIATGAFYRMGAAALDFAASAGGALIDFGVDSVKMAGDFEATLNSFAAVSGPLDEAGLSVDDFKEKFLQLGADTKYSAQEAAQAGYELVKGGIAIEDVMGDATEATLALASASGIELATAADIVAKQLGAWGDQGLTATQAANLLTQAANASSTSVEELAKGLSNTGGIAELAGAEFEDIVTSLALIAPGFASSAEAGTALRSMLAGFTGKTKPAREAMAELGLLTTNYEEALQFLIGNGIIPAGTALSDFGDAGEEIDAAMRQYVLATTGAQQGTDKFDKALGKLYDKFNQSTFFDAQGNFIGMAAASEELSKALSGLSEKDKLEALDKIFGVEGGQAAAALAQQGAAGFNEMAAAMGATGTAADQAAKMNQGFNAIMEALSGSIDTVKIRIGDFLLPVLSELVSGYVIPAVNAFDSFLAVLSKTGDPMAALATLAANAGAAISGALPGIQAAFSSWAQGAVAWAIDAAPGVLTGVQDLAMMAVDGAISGAIMFGEAMLGFAQQTVAWVGPALPGVGDALGQLLNTMVNWVVNSLPIWIGQLQQLGMAAIRWVQDALPGLGTNLGQMAGNILAWIAQTAIDVVPKLAALGVKFVAWVVTDVLPELVPTLLKIGEAIGNFIYEAGVALGPKIHEFATKFYTWITDVVVPELPKLLGQAWDTISTWIDEAADLAWKGAQYLGEQLIAGITEGVMAAAQGLYDATIGVVADALGGVGEYLGIQSPSTLARDMIGRWILPGIAEGIIATAPALEQTMVDSLGAAIEAGQSTMATGAAEIAGAFGTHLAAEFTKPMAAPNLAAMFDAGRALRDQISPMAGIGSGPRIQPPAPAPTWASQSSVTNNGPSITYSPTYNTPAPPPAMSYATLNALAGA